MKKFEYIRLRTEKSNRTKPPVWHLPGKPDLSLTLCNLRIKHVSAVASTPPRMCKRCEKLALVHQLEESITQRRTA